MKQNMIIIFLKFGGFESTNRQFLKLSKGSRDALQNVQLSETIGEVQFHHIKLLIKFNI